MTGWILIGMLAAILVLTIVLNIRKRGWRCYLINLLISLDQFGNALMGGMPDETISSRCARGSGRYWYWTLLGRILDAIQPNHTATALESERNRRHAPEALR